MVSETIMMNMMRIKKIILVFRSSSMLLKMTTPKYTLAGMVIIRSKCLVTGLLNIPIRKPNRTAPI
jgi:hypothetical protein